MVHTTDAVSASTPGSQIWVTDRALLPETLREQTAEEKTPDAGGWVVDFPPSADYVPPTAETYEAVAPIRQQYLLAAPAHAPAAAETEADAADTNGKRAAEPTGSGDRNKRQRGQNKDRLKVMSKVRNQHLDVERGFCNSLGQDIPCPKGATCKFSHDLDAFVTIQQPNLGERCPTFDLVGRCRFGLFCRFHKAHTDEKHRQITDAARAEAYTETRLNQVNSDVIFSLRRHRSDTMNLPRSIEFIECTEEEIKANQIKQASQAKKSGVEKEASVAVADDTVSAESTPAGLTPAATTTTTTPAAVEPAASEVKVEHAAYLRLTPREKKRTLNFRDKTYLAPLTTVGNLPFRRICKDLGVDITCGEMVMANDLLQGGRLGWSHVHRHASEDLFGIQLCSSTVPSLLRAAEVVQQHCPAIDFVDLNLGCPTDDVYKIGGGSALLESTNKLRRMVQGLDYVLDCPVTVKLRTGISKSNPVALSLLPKFEKWGVSLATLHGRTRQQRYNKLADWDYIRQCRESLTTMPLYGNGDVMSWTDYYDHKASSGVAGLMVGRGALIKPWIFDEIKERRTWDISSRERLDLIRTYCRYGLEHWGSDTYGVNQTRRFLCEWFSFLHRYIPVGLLEVLPQKMNERPPYFQGRDELETLLASPTVQDWVKISEMFLGPAPESFVFVPKHRSNAYDTPQSARGAAYNVEG
ncbi:tRNA-dihydrouridine synthase 3 [Tieghemiomyces parasiticus]|uniref:tRNA-dihydrouridine(47) synthase [NAD(P)(+)] n=1 Tax=Tieghemiomyces parasiticus TaxID=78921 RepID=A0A9W8AJ91_9FUNG|nr:tRNA-dihydrouridine synthase 3 [Tieghemiomyces parasiticus]